MVKAAKFKVGDRVLVMPYNSAGRFGTIESAPKTERGKKYLVRYEGGYILNGKDCPQYLDESYLSATDSLCPSRGSTKITERRVKHLVESEDFAKLLAASYSATLATRGNSWYAVLQMLIAFRLSVMPESTLEYQTEAILSFVAENTAAIHAILEQVMDGEAFMRELDTQQEAA